MTYSPYICDYCDEWGGGCWHGGCCGRGVRTRRDLWEMRKDSGMPLLRRLCYLNRIRKPRTAQPEPLGL